MKDAFALFGFERRPAVDAAELQERYLQRAAILHPDSAQGDTLAFVELGTARAVLEDPAERLNHLIELQGGLNGGPSFANEVIVEMTDLAALLLEANQQISRIANVLTPLARAVSLQSARNLLNRLEQAENRITLLIKSLDEKVESADQSWPDIPLAQLAQLAASLRFARKRRAQISETSFQLRCALGVSGFAN